MILRRNDADRFSRVTREWEGETAVLLGGGPSLTQQQAALVKVAHEAGRVRCIAINDAFLLAPFSDVSYFADAKWFVWMRDGIPKQQLGMTADQVRERWAGFAGQKCSIENSMAYIDDPAVHLLRNAHYPYHGTGLSLDPGRVVTGRNSGFQALNMAILAGAKRIILLGFDGRPDKEGKTHFFGEHPTPTPVAVWQEIQRAFSAAEGAIAAAGVRVVNCSPGTFIDTFEKMELADALHECAN